MVYLVPDSYGGLCSQGVEMQMFISEVKRLTNVPPARDQRHETPIPSPNTKQLPPRPHPRDLFLPFSLRQTRLEMVRLHRPHQASRRLGLLRVPRPWGICSLSRRGKDQVDALPRPVFREW